MPVKLPILTLPFLNIEQILLNLNPVDLIEFSLLSKKCQKIVKSVRLPFTGMELLISRFNLDLIVKTGDKQSFKWVVNSDHAKKCRVFRKINGRKMRFYKLPPRYILSKCPQPALSFSKVSKYLIELFRCPVTYVQLYPDGLQNIQLLVSGFTNCLDMKLAGNEQIANEDLAFLLENVQVDRDFTFWIQPKPDFICPESVRFQGKSLFITNYSDWFTRELFINSRLESLYVPHNSNINCSDFADFIAEWMNSGDTKLQNISFHGIQMEVQMNAFDRFNPKKWDPKERGRNYPMNPNSNTAFDCSNGLDILRDDGLLATLLIKQYSIDNHYFQFFVWHERFPATGTHVI